jgi:hypothetical protein
MIIEFEYNNKLRNVELNDEGKILYNQLFSYIKGLELDEKNYKRVYKTYIKKNMLNVKIISDCLSSDSACGLKDNTQEVYGYSKKIDNQIIKHREKTRVIEFTYTKSNPEKLRRLSVDREDEKYYYGSELLENDQRKYKVFFKKFVILKSDLQNKNENSESKTMFPTQITTTSFRASPMQEGLCSEVKDSNKIEHNIENIQAKRKRDEDDSESVVTSLKRMSITNEKVGNKISGGYINDSFTIENRSGSFVIQKILKGNKVYFLKINSNEIKEISNDEYTILLG